MDRIEVPPPLAGFHMDCSNTQLIVGLPDTQIDFENSWDRHGFARQFRSPDEWRLTVGDALKKGVLRDPREVWRIFDYPSRRRELEELIQRGVNVSVGASIKDLPQLFIRPFEYTKLWTHTHEISGELHFEFVDGFLGARDLGQMIGAGRSQFIDFCACRAEKCVPSLKKMCPDRFFIAVPEDLTGFGWGVHTTFFMKNVVCHGGAFPELWRMTLADLKKLAGARGQT